MYYSAYVLNFIVYNFNLITYIILFEITFIFNS